MLSILLTCRHVWLSMITLSCHSKLTIDIFNLKTTLHHGQGCCAILSSVFLNWWYVHVNIGTVFRYIFIHYSAIKLSWCQPRNNGRQKDHVKWTQSALRQKFSLILWKKNNSLNIFVLVFWKRLVIVTYYSYYSMVDLLLSGLRISIAIMLVTVQKCLTIRSFLCVKWVANPVDSKSFDVKGSTMSYLRDTHVIQQFHEYKLRIFACLWKRTGREHGQDRQHGNGIVCWATQDLPLTDKSSPRREF